MPETCLTRRSSRSKFTRMCIGEAIISLMKEQPFEKISISDIAERAGLSRMTYYHYYHTKQDAIQDYIAEIVQEYLESLRSDSNLGTMFEYQRILHCLNFFDKYANFFLTLDQAKLGTLIIDSMNTYMETKVMPSYSGSIYDLYFYAGALLNTFLQWQKHGKIENAEHLAEMLCKHFSS